jgi:hypothetical protein
LGLWANNHYTCRYCRRTVQPQIKIRRWIPQQELIACSPTHLH